MAKVIKPYYDVSKNIYRVGLFLSEQEIIPTSVSSSVTFKTYKEVSDYINQVNVKIKKDPQRRLQYIVVTEPDIADLEISLDMFQNNEVNYVLEKTSIKGALKIQKENDVEIVSNKDKKSKMLIVADSDGLDADKATKFVINEMKKFFENYMFLPDNHNVQSDINKFLIKLKETSNKLSNYFGGSIKTPSTTMTMAIILDNNILVFNVGDSKCYSINNEDRISLITQDHSYIWDKVAHSSKLDNNYNGKIKSTAMGGIREPQIDTFILEKSKISAIILCNDETKRTLSQLELKNLVVQSDTDITKKIIIYFQSKKGKNASTITKYIHLCNQGRTTADLLDSSVAVWKKR